MFNNKVWLSKSWYIQMIEYQGVIFLNVFLLYCMRAAHVHHAKWQQHDTVRFQICMYKS